MTTKMVNIAPTRKGLEHMLRVFTEQRATMKKTQFALARLGEGEDELEDDLYKVFSKHLRRLDVSAFDLPTSTLIDLFWDGLNGKIEDLEVSIKAMEDGVEECTRCLDGGYGLEGSSTAETNEEVT